VLIQTGDVPSIESGFTDLDLGCSMSNCHERGLKGKSHQGLATAFSAYRLACEEHGKVMFVNPTMSVTFFLGGAKGFRILSHSACSLKELVP
jgi:hypothetical protein